MITSTNPFSSFTFLGAVIVVVLLIAFARNKVVTIFLGTILVAYLLINTKRILPLLYKPNVASSALKGAGL